MQQKTFTLGKFIEANIPSVHLATPLTTIISIFQQYKLSQISVIQNGQLVGVIYKKDIKSPFLQKSPLAKHFLTKNSIKFSIDDSVTEVAEILQMGVFDDVPIVDSNHRFCGIIRWKNLKLKITPKAVLSYKAR